MKLRNKKTGDAVYVDFQIPLSNSDKVLGAYSVTSLKELNEDFEDYIPAEPLIKDEKIRKAVKAWAEINLILDDDDVEALTPTVDCNVLTLTYGTLSIDVFVNDTITIINHGHYTIAELCGEEEE